MAEPPRTGLRLGVVLALAVVALFEVLSLLQGVRSARRLQARVTHDVQQQVQNARPRLQAALARGGPTAAPGRKLAARPSTIPGKVMAFGSSWCSRSMRLSTRSALTSAIETSVCRLGPRREARPSQRRPLASSTAG